MVSMIAHDHFPIRSALHSGRLLSSSSSFVWVAIFSHIWSLTCAFCLIISTCALISSSALLFFTLLSNARDRVLATIRYFPGLNSSFKSYLLNRSIIRYRRGVRSHRFFLWSETKGLWSVSPITVAPYTYSWNFSHAKTSPKSSFSIWA